LNYSLAGGSDGDNLADADRITGYLLYANKDTIPASLLIMGQSSASVINRVIADVAEVRKDAIVCFSPTSASVVNNAGSEVDDITSFISGITRTTYAFMDSGWKYQYNKYTDSYVYVPLNADVAGCMARNDLNREPWISPAGYTNGQIQNIVRLAFNPTQAQRDSLYKLAVNPVITQVGKGTVLFGDKTFTTKNTSTNRINVRRLFIELQRTISNSADNVLFDRNDDITRTNFVNLITPYLRSVQARRGITAFRVVCDTTNNPEAVVNANEFICDIFVQPIRSVNFIQLNFVSVAGAATFNEIAA
jgi:phage tail sheath protein FI